MRGRGEFPAPGVPVPGGVMGGGPGGRTLGGAVSGLPGGKPAKIQENLAFQRLDPWSRAENPRVQGVSLRGGGGARTENPAQGWAAPDRGGFSSSGTTPGFR